MKKIDVFIAIIVIFCWGSNLIAVKYNISEVPSFLSLALRFLGVSLILLPFISKPKIKFTKLYSASIVFGVFYLGLVYYSMYLGINASLAVILMQLATPLSVVVARISLNELITRNAMIGMILAISGAIFVIGSPNSIGNTSAVIVILLAAFFNALFNIQSRKLKAVPPLSLLFWNSLIATPHLLVISYFLEGNPFELLQNTSTTFWWALAYSILAASLIGMSGWIYLLQKYPVYQVMPFTLLIPPIGIFLSIVGLNQTPSLNFLIGGIMTIIGVYITQMKPAKVSRTSLT